MRESKGHSGLNLREGHYLKDLDEDGRVIVKLILKKWVWMLGLD